MLSNKDIPYHTNKLDIIMCDGTPDCSYNIKSKTSNNTIMLETGFISDHM